MTKNGIKTENRLSTLEANYCSLEEKVNEIINNHLAHLSDDVKEIQKSVNNINIRLAIWSGGIVVAIWILERFFK